MTFMWKYCDISCAYQSSAANMKAYMSKRSPAGFFFNESWNILKKLSLKTSGRATYLKRKIDTGWMSNISISFHSAEAENQKIPGMQFAVRIVQIEGCACKLPSIYDSSLWSCTTWYNWPSQSRVEIQQGVLNLIWQPFTHMRCILLSLSLIFISSVSSFDNYLLSWEKCLVGFISDTDNWSLCCPANVIEGKRWFGANWMILLLQTAFDDLNKCPITVRWTGWCLVATERDLTNKVELYLSTISLH